MKKLVIITAIAFFAGGIALAVKAVDRERIPAPADIKNFREVRKEGNMLTGIRVMPSSTVRPEVKTRPAENASSEKKGTDKETAEKKTVKEPVLVKTEMKTCVSAAIDKKDAGLKSLLVTHQEAVNSAIDARNACQKAALEKAAAREQATANKTCVAAYQTAMRKNLAATKTAKETNWKTFRQDLKACSSSGSEEIEIQDGENQF